MRGEAYLREKRDQLKAALDREERQIEVLRAEGKDASVLETQWARRLRLYEALCGAIRTAELEAELHGSEPVFASPYGPGPDDPF